MIAPLRRRHRWTWVVLAVGVPALYVAALAARPTWPTEPARGLPSEAGGAERPRVELAGEGVAVSVTDEAVVVEPLGGPLPPDLCLYWTSTESGRLDGMPGDARLLGAVGAGRVVLPHQPLDRGTLCFYSVAYAELRAVLPLPLSPDEER